MALTCECHIRVQWGKVCLSYAAVDRKVLVELSIARWWGMKLWCCIVSSRKHKRRLNVK